MTPEQYAVIYPFAVAGREGVTRGMLPPDCLSVSGIVFRPSTDDDDGADDHSDDAEGYVLEFHYVVDSGAPTGFAGASIAVKARLRFPAGTDHATALGKVVAGYAEESP